MTAPAELSQASLMAEWETAMLGLPVRKRIEAGTRAVEALSRLLVDGYGLPNVAAVQSILAAAVAAVQS
jgi:hypothetical protein